MKMATVLDERELKIRPNGALGMKNIKDSINLMMLKLEQHENNLEEKIAERTLELSEAYKKSQGASRVKSDILKIVSHEMKTPLHSAMYYLRLMNSGDGYFVSEVIECLERLQTQVDNLLEYSKAVEKNIVLNKATFALSDLLEMLLNELEPLFLSRNNQLIVNCNYEGTIFSDEQLVRQILVNIIGNANKYTCHGKVNLMCASNKENSTLDISILDTGCGIPEHQIKDIFKPFWRADMSSEKANEGTGLGLSICHLFSEAIGAKITVESNINKGSVFTLRLPLSMN